jgi:hypothetical protein
MISIRTCQYMTVGASTLTSNFDLEGANVRQEKVRASEDEEEVVTKWGKILPRSLKNTKIHKEGYHLCDPL